jgi:hypothetical protein
LKKKASAPFEVTYRAEIDESPVLGPKMANYFQSQIGILRWCVELGRIDIITEVSMLCTFLCMPREGHLDAVYYLFAYLYLHHNARVVFDPTYPDVDMSDFIETDVCKNFCTLIMYKSNNVHIWIMLCMIMSSAHCVMYIIATLL